jgi:hypothetical protein
MSAFPEIREPDAPPEIAAIYGEMRRAMRLPLVNLIWRHLATMPGVLPWAWSLVRPLAATGALDAALARLLDAAPRLELGEGKPLAAEPAALAVVRSYNRGNAMNLVALSAVLLALENPAAVAKGSPPGRLSGDAVMPIPPLPRLAELDRHTAATVRDLAERHGGGPDVVPSLYLHLAHWPAVLDAAAARLRPRLDDGSVKRAREATRTLGLAEARALLPRLATDETMPPAHIAATRQAIDLFTSRMIPAMIPVGLALERLLTAPEQEPPA